MSAADIQAAQPAVRKAVQAAVAPVHPEDDRIPGVSHVMWCDLPSAPARTPATPCSTALGGSTARPAAPVLGADGAARRQGRLAIGEAFVHESIIGSLFHCRVEAADEVGNRGRDPAERRRLGAGHRPQHDFVDERDPLAFGFIMR